MEDSNKLADKELFESFLEKVHLDGQVDMALIDLLDDQMNCYAFIQHKMLGIEVSSNRNVFDKSGIDLPIASLEILYKMVKSFGDGTKFSLKSRGGYVNDDRIHHIRMDSDLTHSRFILGKRKAIDNKKKLDTNKFDDWLFKFDFTQFADKYRKFQNILKNYDTFYFSTKKGKVKLNFGGLRKSTENSIVIDLDEPVQKEFNNTILFNKDIFNSIISANKESNIHVYVNKDLYMVKIKDEYFNCTYFNTKTKNQ